MPTSQYVKEMELTRCRRVAPAFMAIGCVSTFGRIIWWITPLDSHQFRLLWCHPRAFAPVLMLLVLVSAILQLGGAYSLVTTLLKVDGVEFAADGITFVGPPDSSIQYWVDVAANLVRSGLVLQIAVLGSFVVVSTRYILISRRWMDRTLVYAPRPGANWRVLSWTVYTAVILIIVSNFVQNMLSIVH
jgi:hypothetical protein